MKSDCQIILVLWADDIQMSKCGEVFLIGSFHSITIYSNLLCKYISKR